MVMEEVNVMISRDLWHNRIGHPSSEVLSSLLKNLGVSNGSKFSEHSACDACLRAKQSRTQFFSSENKANGLSNLVHCDIWGHIESLPYVEHITS